MDAGGAGLMAGALLLPKSPVGFHGRSRSPCPSDSPSRWILRAGREEETGGGREGETDRQTETRQHHTEREQCMPSSRQAAAAGHRQLPCKMNQGASQVDQRSKPRCQDFTLRDGPRVSTISYSQDRPRHRPPRNQSPHSSLIPLPAPPLFSPSFPITHPTSRLLPPHQALADLKSGHSTVMKGFKIAWKKSNRFSPS